MSASTGSHTLQHIEGAFRQGNILHIVPTRHTLPVYELNVQPARTEARGDLPLCVCFQHELKTIDSAPYSTANVTVNCYGQLELHLDRAAELRFSVDV